MQTQSYIPLARKYRPSTFGELAGQDATSIALSNAIQLGREPHGVIFSGVRGVGKTTTARLYAKALNCSTSRSGEPCNVCESCVAITRGLHEDVIEIDGASNTSVDDIRALRETVHYVPQRSKFRVYIIDEVHMLSQSAFNALLKTLEEPPKHVVFVFATTELQKIPQTILSRCQLFYLQKLSISTISKRLMEILQVEKIPFEERALTVIAKEGHGSMRDALTLLDHVISVGNGKVDVESLERVVAHVSTTRFFEILKSLVLRDGRLIVTLFDDLDGAGISIKKVAEELAIMARHAAVVRDVGTDSSHFRSLGLDSGEVEHLREIGRLAGPGDLNRIFRMLSKARTELDGSSLDRFILENYCLEWCFDPGVLLSFIQPGKSSNQSAKIDVPLSGGGPRPVAEPPKSMHSIREQLAPKPAAVQVSPQALPTVAPVVVASSTEFPSSWREMVESLRKSNALVAKRLEEVHLVGFSEGKIELIVSTDSFLSATLLKAEEQRKLLEILKENFSFKGQLVVMPKKVSGAETSGASKEPLPETLGDTQRRERGELEQRIVEDAKNHPITKDAVRLFDATIESVEVTH